MKPVLFLLFLLSFLACKHDPDCEGLADETAGIVTAALSDRVAYDQRIGQDLGINGIQITTTEEYERVFAHCCAGSLDTVDFAKSDVIGMSTVNRGCRSSYLRDVQRDDTAKRITYTVTERYCKRCSPVDGRGNFVVIPKVPDGYEVKYVRRQ